jgi:hypothetical protein
MNYFERKTTLEHAVIWKIDDCISVNGSCNFFIVAPICYKAPAVGEFDSMDVSESTTLSVITNEK